MTEHEALGLFRSHVEFAARFYKITGEDGRVVPFHSFALGRRISETMRKIEAASAGAGHLVILKPRRGYASAHIASEMHRRVAFYSGRKGVVIAQQLETAHDIVNYAAEYDHYYRLARYGLMDEEGQWVIEPDPDCIIDPLERIRKHESRLKYIGGGSIIPSTAKSPQALRGRRANFLHLSEAGYYKNAFDAMLRACLNCVPKERGNWIVLESTASGQGNLFHQFWLRARSGVSEWGAVFVGTHEIERYRRPVHNLERFMNTLTKLERARQSTYKLTPEQVAWFRHTLENSFQGDIDAMRAEYPYSEEEAFVGSGRAYFDLGVVGVQPAREPSLTGALEISKLNPLREQVVFVPRSDGRGQIRVWEVPRRGEGYIIGADIATGRDVLEGKGAGKADPDWSVANVFKLSTGELVAQIRVRLTAGPFSELLYLLSWWYNWAFMVPEMNSYGQAVVERLMNDLEFPATRMYVRSRAQRADMIVTKHVDAYGFETTTATRIPMLEKLHRMLRDGEMYVTDPTTKGELATFVHKQDRPEHEQGCHDDTVFACALAAAGWEQAQLEYERVADEQEEKRPEGVERFKRYRHAEALGTD